MHVEIGSYTNEYVHYLNSIMAWIGLAEMKVLGQIIFLAEMQTFGYIMISE